MPNQKDQNAHLLIKRQEIISRVMDACLCRMRVLVRFITILNWLNFGSRPRARWTVNAGECSQLHFQVFIWERRECST